MRSRRRALRLSAVLAMSCALSAPLAAGPASADDNPSASFTVKSQNSPWKGQKGSYSVVLTRTAAAVAQNGQALPAVIYCGGGITNPTVVGGRVVADSTAECTDVVDTIEVAATLVVNGVGQPWQIGSAGPSSRNGISAFAACSGTTATYQSLGAARFTKAGYANSPLVMSGGSAQYSLSC